MKERQRTRLRLVVQQLVVTFDNGAILLFRFVPADFAANYTEQSAVTIFVANCFAIRSAAALLSRAVDEATLHLGDTVGGLLNMSFGYVATTLLIQKVNDELTGLQ